MNRDGHLILIMSEEEIVAYKNSNIDVRLGVFQRILGEERDIGVEPYMPEDDLVKTFLDGLDTCGLEISDDYTKIYESPDDNSLYFGAAIHGCILMQILEGKDSEDIRVEYLVLNKNGDVSKRICWPDDLNEEGELIYRSN